MCPYLAPQESLWAFETKLKKSKAVELGAQVSTVEEIFWSQDPEILQTRSSTRQNAGLDPGNVALDSRPRALHLNNG